MLFVEAGPRAYSPALWFDALVPVEQAVQVAENNVIVGIELRSDFDRAVNFAVDRIQRPQLNYLCASAPTAFAHSEHGGLTDRPATSVEFIALVFVALFPADETFIDLNDSAQLVERPIGSAARLAEPTENKPSRLLRDADFLSELQAADALPGGDQQIHAVEPFMERHFRAFENCIGADCEIELARQASVVSWLPRGARSKGAHTLPGLAIRANGAGGPESALQVDARRFFIREQREQLKRADRGAGHLFCHPLNTSCAVRVRHHIGPLYRVWMPAISLPGRTAQATVGLVYCRLRRLRRPMIAHYSGAWIAMPVVDSDYPVLAGFAGHCVVLHHLIVANYTDVVKYKLESI